MSEYVYQEFPKVKYHPKLGTKTVENAEEEKALGNGWYNNPGQFPKPSKIVTALKDDVKPWWQEWQWIFVGLGAMLTAIYTLMKIFGR